MEVDILKPDTGVVTIERPLHMSSSKGTSSRAVTSGQTTPERMHYTEPVSEGEEEEMDLAPARDEDKRTGLSNQQVAAAVAIREKNLKDRERERVEQQAQQQREQRAQREQDQEAADEADVESDAEEETTPFLRGRDRERRQEREAATAKSS